jgi:hypothetical protein
VQPARHCLPAPGRRQRISRSRALRQCAPVRLQNDVGRAVGSTVERCGFTVLRPAVTASAAPFTRRRAS